MPLLVPLFALLALTAALAIPVIVCMRSVREGGWTRLVRVFLVMAAAAFLTWIVCHLRLSAWQSKQHVQNRINVCMLSDNLTALIDIGDEKLMREYVGFFGTNGCTLLNYDLMQKERGRALQEQNLGWHMRLQELLKDKADRKAETK